MTIDTRIAPEATVTSTVTTSLRNRRSSVRRRLVGCVAAAVAMIVFFLTWDALEFFEIIGPLRATRLVGLIVVAVALSVSTVVFQVVTRNRILSPSVMGFDSMFALVATGTIFVLGSTVAHQIPPPVMFAIHATVMSLMAVTLFTVMIGKGHNTVHLLVLVGIVIGTFLRSLTTMMVSIMDPNEYLTVQDAQMASFAVINEASLVITVIMTAVVLALIWWRAGVWDLLSLGPDLATALGVRYRSEVKFALGASAVLVACATALVGPLMFFGLLIVNIAVYLIGSSRIRDLMIGAGAIGITVLIGGQALLEHVLDQATVLPVVIELVGGTLLLVMIVKAVRSR